MNKKEMILTPEELYVLGGVLNAKYIDYAYIAALTDMGSNPELYKKEAIASLVSKGILEEDFAGNMIPNELCISLFTPIFFGKVETSLSICNMKDALSLDIYNFHFYDNDKTMVRNHNNLLMIREFDSDEMKRVIQSIVMDSYNAQSNIKRQSYDQSEAERIIAAKSIEIGETSRVKNYIDFDGVLYYETEDTKLLSLSAEDFCDDVYQIIKGVS